jgi:hypothetical protein
MGERMYRARTDIPSTFIRRYQDQLSAAKYMLLVLTSGLLRRLARRKYPALKRKNNAAPGRSSWIRADLRREKNRVPGARKKRIAGSGETLRRGGAWKMDGFLSPIASAANGKTAAGRREARSFHFGIPILYGKSIPEHHSSMSIKNAYSRAESRRSS